MALFFALVCVLFISTQATAEYIYEPYPTLFKCPGNQGIYPDPKDCSGYYNCWNGIPQQRKCPDTLKFNPETKLCDFAFNVPQCGTKIGNMNYLAPVADVTCPSSNGLFKDPGSCNNYIDCVNNNAFRSKCPDKTSFNEEKKICDWNCNVDKCGECGPSENFVCLHDGLWPDQHDCSAYWQCKGFQAKHRKCIPGMVFNKDSRECDFLNAVTQGCLCPVCPPPPIYDPNKPCPRPYGLFKGPTCETYYNCYGGSYTIQNCPPGLVFNPRRNYCDHPGNVPGCGHITSPPKTSPKPCKQDTRCYGRPDGCYVSEDCKCYYYCVAGCYYQIEICLGGAVWNNIDKICGYFSLDKECKPVHTLPTTPSTTTTTAASESCPPCPEVDPESCEYYYVCECGKRTRKKCPDGLVFNTITRRCDSRCNVPRCSQCIKTTQKPSPCQSSLAYYSYPADCSKYGICMNYQVLSQDCPTGFYFNERTGICDWSFNSPYCYAGYTYGNVNTYSRVISTPVRPEYGQCYGNSVEKIDCQYYTICLNGIKIRTSCPDYLAFNPKIGVCDWPIEVPGCEARERPVYALGYRPSFTCPQPNGVFRNPGDCTSFYQCINYVYKLERCQPGFYFNQANNVCDWPSNVNCPSVPVLKK